MKNGSKINPKSNKKQPKIDQKSPEIKVWRRLGDVLEASWDVLGRLGSILACLGKFRAVLMAVCGYLGPSGRRICVVLEASWRHLGGVLGRHVGVFGASWRYLVPDLQSNGGLAIFDAILELIFGGFCFPKSIPES